MLAFEYNKFNGIIINSDQIPEDIEVFLPQLNALLSHAKQQNKAVIWLTLPIDLAHLITIATTQGFTFHNCLPNEVTLTFKSQPQDFVPFVIQAMSCTKFVSQVTGPRTQTLSTRKLNAEFTCPICLGILRNTQIVSQVTLLEVLVLDSRWLTPVHFEVLASFLW